MVYIFYIHLFFPTFYTKNLCYFQNQNRCYLVYCYLHKLSFCPDAPEEGASASSHSHNSWITRQVRDAAQVSKDSNLRCLPFLGSHIPFLGLLEICIKEVYLNAPMKVSSDLFPIEPSCACHPFALVPPWQLLDIRSLFSVREHQGKA